jgi:hypothetical protein
MIEEIHKDIREDSLCSGKFAPIYLFIFSIKADNDSYGPFMDHPNTDRSSS